MKRPVTLVLVASLLVSASAFAGKNVSSQIASRMVANDSHNDSRHGNDRGNDNRGGWQAMASDQSAVDRSHNPATAMTASHRLRRATVAGTIVATTIATDRRPRPQATDSAGQRWRARSSRRHRNGRTTTTMAMIATTTRSLRQQPQRPQSKWQPQQLERSSRLGSPAQRLEQSPQLLGQPPP